MKRSDQVLIDYYRCPEEFVHVGLWGNPSERPGFFRFGPQLICYGNCSAFVPSPDPELISDDAFDYVKTDDGGIVLPFDVTEIASALRCETYVPQGNGIGRKLNLVERAGYYAVRPMMPVSLRKHLQRYSLRGWARKAFPDWPVDTSVESIIQSALALFLPTQKKPMPFIWFWPDGAQACAVMTHDVETAAGRDFCDHLMDIDDSYGMKASFQVIPERRYVVPASYLRRIRERGFEVNVHDLNHDGNLYREYKEFKRRAASINRYGKKFAARGFRAGALYRNIDWYDLLDFEYDMSVPNVAHLDPQHGGCCTTFPYFIGKMLEIPVTMTQDYSLFNILGNYRLDLWEMQMAMILQKHGVMNFIVHPDYIIGKREQRVYGNLLSRLDELREKVGLWIALPGDVSRWWRMRSQMRLLKKNDHWEIIGEGREHARIAYACLENEMLVYTLDSFQSASSVLKV